MKVHSGSDQSFLYGMDEEEKEIVVYGMKQIPLYAATYVSLVVFMCGFHLLWQGIFYAVVYFSIRKYTDCITC